MVDNVRKNGCFGVEFVAIVDRVAKYQLVKIYYY